LSKKFLKQQPGAIATGFYSQASGECRVSETLRRVFDYKPAIPLRLIDGSLSFFLEFFEILLKFSSICRPFISCLYKPDRL